MKNEIVKFDIPEMQGVEKSKAEQIKATFEPMVKMLEEFEAAYNSVIAEAAQGITQAVTMRAKRIRLDVGKVRIQTGKIKDKQKEYIKLEDRAIMGVHNIIVWAVRYREDRLKEIENWFEIQEQKRIEKLQSERAEKLSKYVEDAFERNLSNMDKDVWIAYFEAMKKQHEDRIAAEKKAEADRIAKEKAEAEERERIRKENERLKKEAEAQAKKLEDERKEREKIEAARKAKEEKERKEREAAAQAERQAYELKLRKAKEAQERIEKIEREKRLKLEAELKAKKEAEKKAEEQKEAARQAELSKGDAAKIKDLINDLNVLKSKYDFKSVKNQKMYNAVKVLIDKTINYIKR